MEFDHLTIRVAIYARVSSDQQAESGTIASQVAALRERVQQDGLRLDEASCFLDEGYSGTTLLRPALERLRDAVAGGGLDRLYIHSPDRLARKYAYQFLLIEEFRRAGVALHFLNRGPGQTPEEELLLQVQGVVAEYERAKILERSRRGKQHAARRGDVSVLGHAPYGYRYVGKREGGGEARYEVVWEEARVVQEMFTWVGRDRLSLGEVARRLTERGLPTRTGKARWHPRTVWGILTNPAYRGAAQFGKTRSGERRPRLRPRRGQPEQPRQGFSSYETAPDQRIPIAVPALVSAALFESVAEQLAENQKRNRQSGQGGRYLLQGLLVCARCGYALHGKRTQRRGADGSQRCYTYYRCTGTNPARFGGQKLCHNRPVRAAELEEAVWQDVCALLGEPQKIEEEYKRRLSGHKGRSEPAAREARAKRIGQVKRGIARLIDAYGEGLLDKGEFEPRVRGAKERLRALEEEEKAEADQEAQEQELRLVIGHVQEFADNVKEGLHDANWQSRREILRALVKRVEVSEDQVRLVYRVSPPPFAESPPGGSWQDCERRRGRPGGQPPGRPGGKGRSSAVDELHERLNDIFQAQRCGGPEVGMSEVTRFLVIGLYLDDTDLEVIQPHLMPRDADLPELGDVGRYMRVPVFRKGSAAAVERPPDAEHRGIGFSYCPMDHVFM
jgi:site-specific DNA recombinase